MSFGTGKGVAAWTRASVAANVARRRGCAIPEGAVLHVLARAYVDSHDPM